MTNTVSYPASTWINADGLPVRFGRGAQVDAVVGYVSRMNGDVTVTADIVFDRLPALSANEAIGQIYGGYPNVAIPAGAYIKSAILITSTAFTGTGATLSIGLVDKAGVELDNDGLIDALAVASMGAGTVNTGAGALINTVLAATAPAYYIWATVQSTTFTAGVGRLEVTYFIPDPDKNNT